MKNKLFYRCNKVYIKDLCTQKKRHEKDIWKFTSFLSVALVSIWTPSLISLCFPLSSILLSGSLYICFYNLSKAYQLVYLRQGVTTIRRILFKLQHFSSFRRFSFLFGKLKSKLLGLIYLSQLTPALLTHCRFRVSRRITRQLVSEQWHRLSTLADGTRSQQIENEVKIQIATAMQDVTASIESITKSMKLRLMNSEMRWSKTDALVLEDKKDFLKNCKT